MARSTPSLPMLGLALPGKHLLKTQQWRKSSLLPPNGKPAPWTFLFRCMCNPKKTSIAPVPVTSRNCHQLAGLTDRTAEMSLDAFDITSVTSSTDRDILVNRDAGVLGRWRLRLGRRTCLCASAACSATASPFLRRSFILILKSCRLHSTPARAHHVFNSAMMYSHSAAAKPRTAIAGQSPASCAKLTWSSRERLDGRNTAGRSSTIRGSKRRFLTRVWGQQ